MDPNLNNNAQNQQQIVYNPNIASSSDPNEKKITLKSKKILLLIVILFAIPLTVALVLFSRNSESNASPSATLTFNPINVDSSKNEIVELGVYVYPGESQIKELTAGIKYDSKYLRPVKNGFKIDPNSPLELIAKPRNENGLLIFTITQTSDPTKVISMQTKIGAVSFKAINIAEIPTIISFDPTITVAKPLGGEESQNVVSNLVPANIIINPIEVLPSVITPKPTINNKVRVRP